MSEPIATGYPPHHESCLTLKDGRRVILRPILPTDGHLLVDLFNKISPQGLYTRFLGNLQTIPEDLLYHFTHVDYDKEFALVAVVNEVGNDAVVGVARYAHDAR